MKIYKCLKIAINMVTHSKLRSWLTIIGIVIGVASVITLVSIGNGMEAGTNDELSGLGGNIITITPGYSKASGMGMPGHGPSSGSGSVSESDTILGRNDVQALKSIPELEYIDTNIKDSADVYYFGKSAQLTVTGVLGFVAGISLLVGAVGIANTMFTAVLEKTKEIGIMKAIGARNKDIMLIFLFNSGLVGIIGGIIGVFFGIVASYLLGGGLMSTPRGDSIETVVSLQIVVLALFISVVVGISAGMIPAYQGSKLKPVDALRYE
jgi:ABC-type antimicrobial peptide transport system permease subunit